MYTPGEIKIVESAFVLTLDGLTEEVLRKVEVTMAQEFDPVLEGLSEQQLKDLIVRNVTEITQLRADAKAFAKSSREAIKALDDRNANALEVLREQKELKQV